MVVSVGVLSMRCQTKLFKIISNTMPIENEPPQMMNTAHFAMKISLKMS